MMKVVVFLLALVAIAQARNLVRRNIDTKLRKLEAKFDDLVAGHHSLLGAGASTLNPNDNTVSIVTVAGKPADGSKINKVQTPAQITADLTKFGSFVTSLATHTTTGITPENPGSPDDSASARMLLSAMFPGLQVNHLFIKMGKWAAAAAMCPFSKECRDSNIHAKITPMLNKLQEYSAAAWAKIKPVLIKIGTGLKKAWAATLQAASFIYANCADIVADVMSGSLGVKEAMDDASKKAVEAVDTAAEAEVDKTFNEAVTEKLTEDMTTGSWKDLSYVLVFISPLMDIFMPSDGPGPVCSKSSTVMTNMNAFSWECPAAVANSPTVHSERQLGLCYVPCQNHPDVKAYEAKHAGTVASKGPFVWSNVGPVCWLKGGRRSSSLASFFNVPKGIGRGAGIIGNPCTAPLVRHGLWGCIDPSQPLCAGGATPWGKWCPSSNNQGCNPVANQEYSFSCGLYCTRDRYSCFSFVFGIVAAATGAALKITALVLTAGASIAVDTGAAAAKAAIMWTIKTAWTQAILGLYIHQNADKGTPLKTSLAHLIRPVRAALSNTAAAVTAAVKGTPRPAGVAADEVMIGATKAMCLTCMRKQEPTAAVDAHDVFCAGIADDTAGTVPPSAPSFEVANFYHNMKTAGTPQFAWTAPQKRCAKLCKVVNDMVLEPESAAKDLIWSLVTSIDPTGIASLAGKFIRPKCPATDALWRDPAEMERIETFNDRYDFMNF